MAIRVIDLMSQYYHWTGTIVNIVNNIAYVHCGGSTYIYLNASQYEVI